MSCEVLINEKVLDTLIEKALPKEYEVLLQDNSLSYEEEQYYDLLIYLINSNINELIDWVNSDKGNRIINRLEELELDFWDEIEFSLKENFKNNFEKVIILLLSFYQQTNKVTYSSLNLQQVFSQQDWSAFGIIKQHNYNVISDLLKDLNKNLRDTLWNGIKEGLDTHQIVENLLKSGLQPTNKFTAQTRAKMIATTERSRVVNTAKLQCYVDNGITEFNIVTAHDNKVCNICLTNEVNNPYTIYEILGMIPSHPHCYMPDTQVYTSKGWKYFYDLNKSDKILSLNPETKETEFISNYKKICHKNDFGYMVRIYNKWFDTCVTPDHDCFIYQRKQINKVRQLVPEFRKPNELGCESKFLRVCENNNESPKYIDVNGLKFKTEDYVFFMAWYISEGSVLHNPKTAKRKNYPIKITQIKEDTRNIIEPIFKKISEYLNIKLYIGKEYFEFHSKELYDYLLPLGYSHEKYVPKIMFGLSKEHINLFLDNYVLGDGTVRKRDNDICWNAVSKTIVTSSKNLVNDLSYLILLSGHYPSISLSSKKGNEVKHKNGIYIQNNDMYRININNSEYASYNGCEVEYIDYSGDVYCVELPKYHTLWTKRNGKTTWNGNCRCTVEPANLNQLQPYQDYFIYIVDLTNY